MFLPLLYLYWLCVDHADYILSVLHPCIIVGPTGWPVGLIANMVSLATPQAQVHVADASPQLCVSSTMATLTLLWPTSRCHSVAAPSHTCCPHNHGNSKCIMCQKKNVQKQYLLSLTNPDNYLLLSRALFHAFSLLSRSLPFCEFQSAAQIRLSAATCPLTTRDIPKGRHFSGTLSPT